MADTISFESIRNGDIKAFETLFKEFYPSMCAIAIRFVSDKDVAQDIVQEVFIKLWEKRTSYEEIPNLKTFLYVSIKNLCFNYLRDKKETIDEGHRLKMLELAIDGIEGLEIETIELERKGISYTYDTMKLLNERDPDTDYYFIIGADMVDYLPKWYRLTN